MRPVVFDMDGVLVDSEPLYEAAFTAYVTEAGHPELTAWFPHTLGRRQVDFAPELAPLVGRAPADVESGLTAATLPLLDGALRPMPYVHEALDALTAGGRVVGLASSTATPMVDRFLEALGIAGRFAAVAGGDEVQRGKPDPEIYLLAASRLGVDARTCVAIEDTPAGVASAAGACMAAVAVPNDHTRSATFPVAHAVVPDLRAAVQEVRALDAVS